MYFSCVRDLKHEQNKVTQWVLYRILPEKKNSKYDVETNVRRELSSPVFQWLHTMINTIMENNNRIKGLQ